MVLSALGLGALPPEITVFCSVLAVAAGLLALRSRPLSFTAYLPAVLPLGLAGYTLLQAVPLPLAVLHLIAPANAEVWTGTYALPGASHHAFATLTADVGATLLEALKWLTYAAVAAAAVAVSARRTAAWVGTLLFASALAVGSITFLHGLVGADRVYGLYTPSFQPGRWHVGPLLNPNNLSGYLNLGLLSGMGLMVARRRLVSRLVVGFGVTTLLAVVIVSASRAGVVAMLCGVGLFLVLVRRTHRREGKPLGQHRLAVLTGLGAALVGAGVLAWLGSTPEMWHELFDKNLEKLDVMTRVLPLIMDHPWFGIGRGAFESVFPAYHVGAANVVYSHAENFVIQWAAEWGVPIAAIAVACLVVGMKKVSATVRDSGSAAGLWAGLIALLLQNFLDLALEVPGVSIAAFAAFGALWGQLQANTGDGEDDASARLEAPSWLLGVAAAGAAGLAVLVLVLGRHGVLRDSRLVRSTLAATDFSDASMVADVRDDILAGIVRHPADPYFLRLAAVVAWRSHQDPMPWIERALERGMNIGETHYELGKMLAIAGARSQALLEFRLAAAHEPNLQMPVGRIIPMLSNDYDELVRAAPDGNDGSRVLYFAATSLNQNSHGELRERLLDTSINWAPDSIEPRATLARDLIGAIGSHSPRCIGAEEPGCERLVEQQVLQIARLDSETPRALLLHAELLLQTGRPSDAERVLASSCARFLARDRATCERVRVRAAFATGSSALLTDASKDLIGAGCAAGPECAGLFAFVGNMFERLGDLGTALSDYQKAADEDPNAHYWASIASLAKRLGDNTLATTALRQASQRSPGDPLLRKQYAAAQTEQYSRMLAH